MSTKQLHLSSQLPLSLGSKPSDDSLSITFASDEPGLPVSLTNDTNYGTPGANTLRTAAMLGVGSTAVSNANPIPISDAGSSITVDGTVAATQSGTWNITNVSGTVSLPTGAATQATLSQINTKLPASLGAQPSAESLSIVFASDATGFPVTQDGFWDIRDITGSITLPTGASTAALQSTGNTSLSTIESDTGSIDGKLPTIGQNNAANSVSVVLASNGTLPLPSGAATEATLATISGQLPSTVGQKTMAASLAVVLASNQTAIPVSQSGTWNITNISGTISLPTGAATETSVASTATNTTTSNIAYTAKGKIAGASLTGSYATLLDPSTDLRIVQLFNSCNQTIFVSLDSGSTDTFELEPAESTSIDLTSNRLKFSNAVNISAKHAGVVPTAGSIRCTGIG